MGFENRLRIDWENTRLTLPCPGITVLGPSAVARLSVCCEHDFLAALEHFVLGTAAEAVRTIERRQFDEDELEFERVLVSSARNAKKLWTLHTFGPQVPVSGTFTHRMSPPFCIAHFMFDHVADGPHAAWNRRRVHPTVEIESG